ncbi:hypothetical protein DL767_004544 [Monosporascus sp. MG133]|nr:hypothetical protein DL767_004544 [Monosporascus sp. MG133]
MVYEIVKSPFFTVTSKSAPCAGGPVYGLGGRSTLRGLCTPKIDEDQSTVSWILEHIFNKSEYLNVLSQTRAMTVNRAKSSDSKPEKVESLTVLDQRGRERILPTGKATIILSAGTIDTAAIALRSGLGGTISWAEASPTTTFGALVSCSYGAKSLSASGDEPSGSKAG